MQHEPYEMNILHTGLGFEKKRVGSCFVHCKSLLNRDVVQNFYEKVIYELNLILFLLKIISSIGFNFKHT